MTTTAAAYAAMMSRNIRHFGDRGTVTIRRPHTLKSQRKGEPIGGTLLLVNGAFAAGAASISLRATQLEGRLVTGCKFTIAGNATVYTTTGQTDAASGVLTAVGITPVLAANAADGTVVTFTQPYADYTFCRMRGDERSAVSDGLERTGRILHLEAQDATTIPEQGDFVIEAGGSPEPIAAVRPVNPGGAVARWTLSLGDIAS